MKIKSRWFIVGGAALILLALVLCFYHKPPKHIQNECGDQGYIVSESNPDVCTKKPTNTVNQPGVTVKLDIPFDILVTGSNGPVKGSNTLITSQSDWQALWHQLYSSISPYPNLTPVDFAGSEVLMVAAGSVPTQGYAIKVTEIADTGTKLVVTIHTAKPPQDCIVAQSITSPYQIIKFAKTPKPLEFNTTQSILGNDCPSTKSGPY